jgi:hypothetical protein
MSLTASPEVIYVDTSTGATGGTSTITYDHKDVPAVVMYQSLNYGLYVITTDLETSGTFEAPLSLGDVYEVRVCRAGDVSGPDVDVLSSVTVICLAAVSAQASLTSDLRLVAGGTYVKVNLSSTAPTQCILECSLDAPVVDEHGRYSFPAGSRELRTTASSGRETHHELELAPLYAGTDYYAVVTVIDAHGNWETQSKTVTTRQRWVQVRFNELQVINDGDDDGTGEAWFSLSIWQEKSVAREFLLGNDEYALEVTDGEVFDLVPEQIIHDIGPETVTAANERIYIATWAGEDDTFAVEKAADFDTKADVDRFPSLDIPIGSGSEQVAAREQVFTANGWQGSKLSFKVTVSYDVDYV